jgi:hypothetical protein
MNIFMRTKLENQNMENDQLRRNLLELVQEHIQICDGKNCHINLEDIFEVGYRAGLFEELVDGEM